MDVHKVLLNIAWGDGPFCTSILIRPYGTWKLPIIQFVNYTMEEI